MKVIIDDKIPYIKGQIETIADSVIYMKGSDIKAADVKDADILIVRTRTHCDRALLHGSRVSLIVTATIGFDHIDTAYCAEAGIKWTNCPGCNASSVCQYIHNSLLVLDKVHPELTIGVVGAGHVGSLVVADCKAEGMKVLVCDPPRQERGDTIEGVPFVTIDEIAEKADIITFHTPLEREGKHPTYHLADNEFFKKLKRAPLIINSSRGAVVNNTALIHAIDTGMVCNAVIDTWENEPDINLQLLQRAVIATPHIAGYSADGKANATRMSLQAVCRHTGIPFTLDIQPPQLPDHLRPTSDNPAERALQLYDPRTDTALLKANPEKFEYFRGNYPLRREGEGDKEITSQQTNRARCISAPGSEINF